MTRTSGERHGADTQRGDEMSRLEEQCRRQDAEIGRLEASLKELAAHVEDLQLQLHNRETEIAEITGSKGWQTVLTARRGIHLVRRASQRVTNHDMAPGERRTPHG